MKSSAIFVGLFFLLALPLISAAQDFGYNRLYSDGNALVPGLNYSINVNHSETSDLAYNSLLFNDYSLFNYINGYVRSQSLVCFLSGGSDCLMQGNILMGNNDIIGARNINMSTNFTITDGRYEQTLSDPISVTGTGREAMNIRNTNPFGIASIRLTNDNVDSFVQLGVFGTVLSQAIFGGQLEENDSAMGITGLGGPIWITTQENKSIFFGGTPDNNLSNTDFSISINPIEESLVFQGNKKIIPKPVDGGFAMVFDSEETLPAGGFPFVFEALDVNNDTVVLSWQQNGANNSFSGQMNSFVTVPKSWILSTNPSMGTDNLTFLFNTSNYPELCEWLQTNLSLIPEDCQYFADTTGRGVPLFATGDAEIWRTMTVHEGATIFNDLDFIGRNGNDVDLLFNGDLESGKLHIRDRRQILANITDFDRVVADFDDGTISPFVSFSVDPEVGRDWDSVSSLLCHDDRCARAAGGNVKTMCFSGGTQNAEDINISFWLTTIFGIGDSINVTIDNNEGDSTTIFTETVSVTDTFESFIMPLAYENKSNVTTCYNLNGQNNNRLAYVDIVRVQATFNPAIQINDTYDGGRIVLGDDDSDPCSIYVDKFISNDTLQPEDRLNLECNTVNFIGNVTQTDITEIELNVTDNVTANNFIAREHYYGNGSFLSGITKTIEEVLIQGDDANGQNITGIDTINASNYIGINLTPTSGDFGFWNRNDTLNAIFPATEGDDIRTTGTVRSQRNFVYDEIENPTNYTFMGKDSFFFMTSVPSVKEKASFQRVIDDLEITSYDGDIILQTGELSTIGQNDLTLNVNGIIKPLFSGTYTSYTTYLDFADAETFKIGYEPDWSSYPPEVSNYYFKKVTSNPGSFIFDANVVISEDNTKYLIGTSEDASFYYDGTDAIIDPKEVGTGKLKVLGDINITENLYVTGNTTQELIKLGNGAWIGYNSTCQMIFYNSTGGVMSTQGCS